MQLLTIPQVAEIVAVAESAVQKLMAEWKVEPIYLGPGRGRGYRYIRDEIVNSIKSHRIPAQKPRPRRIRQQECLLDKDISEIRDILTRRRKSA